MSAPWQAQHYIKSFSIVREDIAPKVVCSSMAELMMLRLQCKTFSLHAHISKAKLIQRQACSRINLLSKSACCIWGAWLKSDARCCNMAALWKPCICDSDRHLILGRKNQERPYESALCELKATRNHDCKGLLGACFHQI